jgi:hypothetical protein
VKKRQKGLQKPPPGMPGVDRPWAAEDVGGIVCNPIYAGVGPYPAICTDEQFVQAAEAALRDPDTGGIRGYARLVLQNLRRSFPSDPEAYSEKFYAPLEASSQQVEQTAQVERSSEAQEKLSAIAKSIVDLLEEMVKRVEDPESAKAVLYILENVHKTVASSATTVARGAMDKE